MIPVHESIAAELEQLGVQVDRTTPDGPYMPGLGNAPGGTELG